MSRWHTDGPLHDHDGERAQARAEAVDERVDELSQDSEARQWALDTTIDLTLRLADIYEYSDIMLATKFRDIVHAGLRARAEREIDA